MAEKSNQEKMLAGEWFNGVAPELLERQARAAELTRELNQVPGSEVERRQSILQRLLGSMAGGGVIESPFLVEYGSNIHLGDWAYVNKGATFLDSAEIRLGSRTMVGPNVQLITVGHPVPPEQRYFNEGQDRAIPFDLWSRAQPITIGSYCWLGAGSIILPGVEIGDGSVIGAGSVVTKSVPARMVAVGSPARVIKSVDA